MMSVECVSAYQGRLTNEITSLRSKSIQASVQQERTRGAQRSANMPRKEVEISQSVRQAGRQSISHQRSVGRSETGTSKRVLRSLKVSG